MKFRATTFTIGLLVFGVYAAACTVSSTDDDDESADGSGGSGGSSTGGSGGSSGGSGGETSSGGSGASASGGSGGSTSSGGSGGGLGEGGAAGSGELPTVELMDCGTRDPAGATVVDADVSQDTTWSGTIYVDGNIDVTDGATITIEPGTDIVVAVDSEIEFGWNSNQATIKAEGSVDAPIRFCGENGDSGFWDGLIVRGNVTSDSVMRNVLIADAGAAGQSLALETSILIENVQVRNGEGDGVRAADFDQDSSQLSVEGIEDVPVVLTHPRGATNFPLGGNFENNGDNTVHIAYVDVEEDTTIHDPGIPYVQESDVDVYDGAELNFAAGVDYRFAANTDLEVGWNSGDATLNIMGTSTSPVVFRGEAENSGFWAGIIIRPNVRTDSLVEYLEIRHAGNAAVEAMAIHSAITLNNLLVEDSAAGVYIDAQGLNAASSNLSVNNVTALPLIVEPNALVTLPEGGDFTENDTNQVGVEGGDFDVVGDVPNLGVPYRVLGDIDVEEGADITLAPGTHFVMTADSDIEFGWNSGEVTVIAVGTEEAPIRFTGADEVAGFWPGLTIQSNVLSNSEFNWVEIGHGGDACLTLRQPFNVTNSHFFDCAGAGILKLDSDTTDYTDGNTFAGVSPSVDNL